MSLSKFAEFIAANKIDARRLMVASHKIESLTVEDRTIRRNKRVARKSEGGGEKEVRKPRSGRPITPRAMSAAMAGGRVSGPTKTRMLRAVNRILEQKKQAVVELKALF